MGSLVPFIVVGLVGGAAYALLALGLVLINKSSGILSFAHGEIGGFATFVVASLAISDGWPWPVAIAAGLVVGTLLGLGSQAVLFKAERFGRLPLLVGTIAVLSLLVVLETRWFGGARPFEPPVHGWIELPSFLGSADVTYVQLLVLGTVVVICAALWFLLERTGIGLRIRAVADHRAAAHAVGLAPRRVEAFTWSLAGALAALAGVFLGWSAQSIAPAFLTIYLLNAFAAAIIGGVTSMPGAVLGGLIVGVAESLARKYWGQTPGSPEAVIFVLLFVVLLVRPQGLLGGSRTSRSPDADSLISMRPLVTSRGTRAQRRRRTGLVTACLAGVVVISMFVSQSMAYRLSIIPIFAIVALSLNSLMAGTGQVSLGHAGLMGVGAFTAAVAASSWHLPFLVAALLGMFATCLVALLLGIAALRVRGLHLAVLTMGFAIVLQAFVFPMDTFSRGGAGIVLQRPEFAGFDFNDEKSFLLLSIAVLAIVWWCDRRFFAAPIGRAWVALRDNELAASARGIRAPSIKVLAFVASGAGAGLAGALFGYRQGVLAATQFPFLLSVTLLLYVVIGGIGVRIGVVAVAGFFAFATTSSSGPSSNAEWLVLLGSAAVVFTIGRYPEGIGGKVRDLVHRRSARRTSVPELHSEPQLGGQRIAPAGAHSATPSSEVVLSIDNLSVTFGGLVALRDISLNVHEGEIVAVVGPNGAGKTTLFNTISGLVAPSHGEVVFRGKDLDRSDPAQRAASGLGRTFQQGGLWLSETARTNLLIAQHLTVNTSAAASLLALGPDQRARERERGLIADEVLRILGLRAEAHQQVTTLTYGNRRVLELGCALVTRPALLLLDEPAAGLSNDESEWLGTVIASIRAQLQISILLIEHHVPLVKSVADTVYVFDMGQLVTSGDPHEVTADARVLEAYLGSGARGLSSDVEAVL